MASKATEDLLAYIEASPSPYHAVETTVSRLEEQGFRRLSEPDVWRTVPGDRVYITRGGGSVAAFIIGQSSPVDAGFRLVGAHTDSPNLRVKPNPDFQKAGVAQLGVEPYGGVLLHTWLDRDLSVAGRIATRQGQVLVDLKSPLLRIPSLAIHLDRSVNKDGLRLNAQSHMAPLVGLVADNPGKLTELISKALDGVRADEILGWDLCAYDVQPPALGGANDEFIFSARLDNLASCHAALTALFAAKVDNPATLGVVLYDHEEVGSRSAQGAASSFLRACVQRLSKGEDGLHRAASRSILVSADMAHGVHPNYTDKHEPQHQPILGGGPVIKINSDQSYATDAATCARFEACARDAGVTTQRFVTRSDIRCGSTIGPISAANLGMATVDVGNPMLSMHSCREMAAAADHPKMISVLKGFFWD